MRVAPAPIAAADIAEDASTRVVTAAQAAMLPGLTARRIDGISAQLAESAEGIEGAVAWVDMSGGSVSILNEQGRIRTVAAGLDAPSLVRRVLVDDHPMLLVAARPGVALFHPCDDRVVGRVAPPPSPVARGTGVRFNDGRIASDGALWIGTCDEADPQWSGSLWRYREGVWQEVMRGLACANGIDESDDGRLWVVDSLRSRVLACDDLRRRNEQVAWRVAVKFEIPEAIPDGLSATASGGAVVALWGGSAAIVLDASCNPVARIDVSCHRVTSTTGVPRGLMLTTAAGEFGAGGLYILEGAHGLVVRSAPAFAP